MFDVLTEISWLAVAAGFAVYFILGILWYVVLFRKAYNRSLGREADAAQAQGAIFIVGPALCSLVIVVTSAVLMRALNVESFGNALMFGVIVGVGYLSANTFNIAINPNMPRPLFYGLISSAYHLVCIVLISLILVAIG